MTTAAVLLLVAGAAGSPGSTADPVWVRAVASASLAKHVVASQVVTRTEVFDGGGKRMESVEEIERLTGWDGDKPVLKTETKRDVVKNSGFTIRVNLKATDNPFHASEEGLVTYARKGEAMVDGRACVIYGFEEKPASGDKSEDGPMLGTAWIEAATGLPVRVEYHPKKLPAHVSAYAITILFQSLPDGASVPREADVEIRGGFLFIKRLAKIHKVFHDWKAPPAPVSP